LRCIFPLAISTGGDRWFWGVLFLWIWHSWLYITELDSTVHYRRSHKLGIANSKLSAIQSNPRISRAHRTAQTNWYAVHTDAMVRIFSKHLTLH
jgi:hypothetical protein